MAPVSLQAELQLLQQLAYDSQAHVLVEHT